MPGKVLGKHGMVHREGDGYRLGVNADELTADEHRDLLAVCDSAVETYLGKRGSAAYDHRRAALGYISGSLRYEVLKRAGRTLRAVRRLHRGARHRGRPHPPAQAQR